MTARQGALALPAGTTSAVAGTLWVVLGNLLTRGVGFAGQVVLGWLLAPEEFGTWALAVSIATAVAALRNGGTSQILIKRGEHYASQAGTIFRFSLAFNFLAMVVLVMVATLVLGERPTLAVVLFGVALSIPVGTPGMLLKARLTIDRRFREVASISFGSSCVWQLSVVALALCGFGAMSFALPPLLQAGYESVASWCYVKSFPGLRTSARASDYWQLFRESRWVMLSAAALALATTGDYFAVAMLSDARTAGLYFFAFQLVVAISAPVYGALETVLPALFTQLDGDRARQIDACSRTIRVMIGAGAPAAATLALAAPPVIHFVWHGAWDEAAGVAQILAACVPAWLLVSAGRALIEARGLWRGRFVVLGSYGVGGMGAAAIGTLTGDISTIATMVAAFYVTFALAFLLVLRKLGLPLRRTVGSVLAPLALTGVALLAGEGLARLLVHDAHSSLRSVVQLFTYVAVVAGGNLLFFRDIWHEIVAVLLRRIKGSIKGSNS